MYSTLLLQPAWQTNPWLLLPVRKTVLLSSLVFATGPYPLLPPLVTRKIDLARDERKTL